MSLKEYRRKRKFEKTPEPQGKKSSSGKKLLTFVVQKHDATRTHYDFRLECDGTLKSWAVPKGPTLTSSNPRLAVHVEDHPIEYGKFEGVIPKGNYGAGTVMIWDAGTYVERNSEGRKDSDAAIKKGIDDGHITFILHGEKLRGEFALVKLKKKDAPEKGWLLIKKHDAEASRMDVLKENKSTATGRSMEEIAAQAVKKGEVWLPKKGRVKPLAKALAPKLQKKLSKPVTRSEPAKVAAMPRRVRAMEPVFGSNTPEGDYLQEPFGRGIRAMAEVEFGRVKLYSKAFLPLEAKHPAIVSALRKLGKTVLIDGEIVKGHYEISDILYYEGKDLRDLPLTERKAMLEKLTLSKPLLLMKEGSGEGDVVAKRSDSPYHSGISRDWIRLKTVKGKKSAPSLHTEKPPLTHLDKIYWREEGYTKGDLIRYYESIADTIVPHLVDRPQSLHRQPDGTRNEGFFHKDMSSFLPRRVKTVRVVSGSSEKTINYALCQDKWSLLYLANMGCIELNPWLSRVDHLDKPDLVVIDLDPDGNSFNEVVKVALEVRKVLKAVGAESYPKTSGASGLHICIPTGAKFDYDTGREFAEAVCRVVNKKMPSLTSVERSPAKRMGKIYLDFLQNRRAQTLAAPYCVRPRPGATVSAPLKWSEVKSGLKPASFTIKNMARRIAKVGDLWKPLLNSSVDIEVCMKRLSRRFHI